MANPREKFQVLLRKLFQFDCAELDFGIYRIMNQKRDVIEKFIEKDLLDGVAKELASGALAEESGLAQQLAEVSAQIKENFGEEALDAEGNLAKEYHATPKGKQYLELRERAASARSSEELEAEIFNHLYAFFSRYYDDGDFMSLRRYSKRDKYAIPYNGEEVYLHWANADQYYIKTGENFTDYSYKYGGWSVFFKMRNADVEQNNVKGAKRFFVPRTDGVSIDKKTRSMAVPFEYRPLKTDEETRYGSKQTQTKILDDAAPKILAAAKGVRDLMAALSHEKRKDAEGNSVSLLEHHLATYARKNASDFFIHKDLKGFLERELDFYLKNEVLNLDELEAGGQSRSPRWFQMMAVMKAIGCRIITFLAQIEDFQKRIFEKKKFVTEVNYCVTLDRVPEELYPEIIKNKAQTDEWKVIYPDLKEKRFDLALLKNETKLVLDTRYFDPGFVDKLLHSMRSSSDECGLLIHSENYQALNLILRKYFRKVRCIYIDPPFNTGDDFVYKDSFQTSSWITLIKDRIEKSIPLITLNGSYYLHLDENADFLGRMILEKLGFEEIKKITFNTNATTDEEADLFGYKSFGNNFALRSSTIYFLKNIDSVFQKLWKPNRNTTTLSIGWLDLIAKMKSGATGKKIADMDFFVEKWVKGNIALTKIDIPEGEKIYPVSDIWNDIFSFTQSEMRTSENLSFTTQKPENMVRRILQASSLPGDLMLDFFAGSGTSCAVAHKLGRQYIGIEMGHHFYEIYQDYSAEEKRWINKIGLLGRMKIALRGDVNFMAVDKDRRSHLSKDINYSGGGCFKYLSLESYEDALDNISFEATDPQKQLQLDDYVLNYMLNFETRQSATFLNVAKLETPFDYKLHRHGKDEPLPVDLPETFNYLIGLHVATRCVYENKGIRYLVYRGKSEGRETAVIWRTTKGWGQKEFEQDKDFVTKEKLTDGAEDVFVNSDSFIPGARSLDAVFKHRMFNED